MKLSDHAKNKLEIYNINEDEVISKCNKQIYEFYDTKEESHIKIIELQEILFAVVYNNKAQMIVTVYRTDRRTINNRQKNKRWI
ncbi:MAG: hypothetical protein HYY40_09585 [Bacteroidetes bacterium]|nr:hypothetical protein [Bacteroidota bacterium]